MKFERDIHGLQGMNPSDLRDYLSFDLAPAAGQMFTYSEQYLSIHYICYRHSESPEKDYDDFSIDFSSATIRLS